MEPLCKLYDVFKLYINQQSSVAPLVCICHDLLLSLKSFYFNIGFNCLQMAELDESKSETIDLEELICCFEGK